VTYENVPHYQYGGANSFQIEMFLTAESGSTYLALSARSGLAGLSAARDYPRVFWKAIWLRMAPA